MIKPIETVYNGYRFRSRLEARWAVFFDTLHIPYQYEVEGYDIDGRWYLPDFWLPDQDCWFEVKPTMTQVEDNYGLFSVFSERVGPLVGFADSLRGMKFQLEAHDSTGGLWVGDVSWYFCQKYGFQLSLHCGDSCTVFKHGYDAVVQPCHGCGGWDAMHHVLSEPRIAHAFAVMRSARF